MAEDTDSDDVVARARALLESQHTFPGPFEFRVVGTPDLREAVVAAIEGVSGPGAVEGIGERPSSAGRYLALHVRVAVASADDVLATFAALQALPGVRAVL